MKTSLFLDTNVILDGLFKSRSNYSIATTVLKSGESLQVQLYTSSSNLVNTIYFLRKGGLNLQQITDTVSGLLKFIRITSPDEHAFRAALAAGFSDLEDAVQYFTALQLSGITYFVTENTKDYKLAIPALPVVSVAQIIIILAAM